MAVQHTKSTSEWQLIQLLNSPFFAPLHAALSHLQGPEFPGLEEWNALLQQHYPGITVHSGHPLRFVAQEHGRLAFESQYEPRCYLSGEVQTREHNWHDFFNALVWLAFPRAKAAINLRHYQALTEANDGHSQRGKVRDMATLFDESGVIVVSSNPRLSELWLNHCWKELFWERRELVKQEMQFLIFGHGLHEKAIQPYIGMTGQGLLIPAEQVYFGLSQSEQLSWLDRQVAAYLLRPEHCRSTQELHPVPLLGVPGWAAENESEQYYDNTSYFRPARKNL